MSAESEVSPGAVRQLREMWEHKTDEPLDSRSNAAFASWIKKFGFPLVVDAVQKESVARHSEDGQRLPPHLDDVPKYAAVERAEEKEPGMRACYLARGLMRQKFFCEDGDREVLSLLTRAMRAGVSSAAMYQAIDENNTLEGCFVALGIDRSEFRIAMGHSVVDTLPGRQFFIRADDPEWPAWNAYLRKTTGKGAPLNKESGWYFPSRMPPVDAAPKRRSRRRA